MLHLHSNDWIHVWCERKGKENRNLSRRESCRAGRTAPLFFGAEAGGGVGDLDTERASPGDAMLEAGGRREGKMTHFSRMRMRFRDETLCAISAAKVLLCIKRRSTSRTFETRNFLSPLGRRWRVCSIRGLSKMEEKQQESFGMHLLVATISNLLDTIVRFTKRQKLTYYAPLALRSGP